MMFIDFEPRASRTDQIRSETTVNVEMFDLNFFTEEQFKKMAAAFNKYVKPDSSALDKRETRNAIKCLDFVPTPTEAEFSSICTSNEVQIEDFVMIIYWYMRGMGTRKQLIDAFERLDTDKDGKVSFDVIAKIMDPRNGSRSSRELEIIRKKMEVLEDDQVDYMKFINQIRPV